MEYQRYEVDKDTRKAGCLCVKIMDSHGHTTLAIPKEEIDDIVDLTKEQISQGKWAYLQDEAGNTTVVKDFEVDFSNLGELRNRLMHTEEMLLGVALVGGLDADTI